ncbi:class I SAM-dependent methyltransferase [Solitalea sp. MAHUQ-68]|uniref:Class I SAM-dependent methyltransferase n=1 Tax=Solitalea agri TaxID=2953739 RepID=A0A9X2F6B1_9SPHI|nr:class I SAM-dependent methyltransferase [Solitalea agri]MCO4292683.1 class I SAM-dependent methyltransferase [Solitalea agri]
MDNAEFNRKKHWDTIYQTKSLKEVSWYQPTPQTSLNLIEATNLPLNAKIIDIGGGDSFLVDHLLSKNYKDISVLDISNHAIERAKNRFRVNSENITWIVSDISDFTPVEQYDIWHDRAAFHFLTENVEIDKYVTTVSKAVKSGGYLIIGTFSEQGPTKCSGIAIKQYSKDSLTEVFNAEFELVDSITIDHPTPFNTLQNFVFCSFKKK